MYYLPQPAFLIPLLGLFIAVTCGLAFKALIQQRVYQWTRNPKILNSYKLEGSDLNITYWGICLGILIFLGGGLQIFGFGYLPAYGTSLLMTIAVSGLIWKQFGEVLLQLQEGGSKALDLDSFY
jgi:dolichyl-phosphate-mannose--protein O-mannosyl transferase